VTPRNATANTVVQYIYPVDQKQKTAALIHLVNHNDWQQVLVFSRTKHGANRIAKNLEASGITAAAIHGNKSQGARTKALANFKSGEVRVLVATDIAARGIDIDQLPNVVNFDLPNVPEDYVHRIGRTGRAGANGQAMSLVSSDETKLLRDIERLIKQNIPRKEIEGFVPSQILPENDLDTSRHGQNRGPRNANGRGNGRNGSSPARSNSDRNDSGSNSDRRPRRSSEAKTEHKDGQRSGEAARGHQPNDSNASHSRSRRPSSQVSSSAPASKPGSNSNIWGK
ncbi:MAG: ATP-dependent RNA helicase RhlE, partial [Shewanella sp.]